MKPRILIVEDDKIIGKNIESALNEEGFFAQLAKDGLEGEKEMAEGGYHCIVLDINLPGKNGFELCKEFRKTDKNTPIILLTAYNELEDKVEGFENGADDYLTKPFYMKELLLRIESLLKRKSRTEESDENNAVRMVGDLSLDTKNKKVFRQNQEIVLTPREFQILEKLINAEGAPVSKTEMVREIWGSSFDFNTNTIEVYINLLRNKIDKPFETHLIKTRVGFGYYI